MRAAEAIIKLVFLRVAAGSTSRKAVVPLVEGSDFEQFLVRVRKRLGLPDGAQLSLSDAAVGPVDSIDKLLEVDEGSTLDVVSELPIAPRGAPRTAVAQSSPTRGPAHRCSRVGGDSVGGTPYDGATPEVRLDMGRGSELDESGSGKYRKRRRDLVSLARSKKFIIALLVVCGLSFASLQLLGSQLPS